MDTDVTVDVPERFRSFLAATARDALETVVGHLLCPACRGMLGQRLPDGGVLIAIRDRHGNHALLRLCVGLLVRRCGYCTGAVRLTAGG